MNKHSIDRLFKKKLSGHELPYPEHLWSSIDQRINDLPQDNRRGGLWISWLGLGLFLLLAGSLGYVWMNSGQGGIMGEGIEQLSANQSVASTQTKSLDLSSKPGSNTDATQKGMEDSPEQLNKTVNKNVLSSGSSSGQINNAVSSSQDYDVSSTKRSQTSDETANKDYIQEAWTSSNNNSSDESLFQADRHEENGSSQNMKRGLENNSNSATDHDLRDVRKIDAFEPCEPYKKYRTIESKDDKSPRTIGDAVADLGGFGKKRFIGRWSLGLVYAPDWHFRTMEVKSPEGEALLNQRKRTETFANAFTTGFEVRLKMRQWSVHTGLHYAQINERNRYVVDGSEQMVNGMLVKGDLTRTVINRQQMVQLPVLLGYEISRGPWALEINAGASIGLKTWSSGEVFDPTTLTYARYESGSANNPYTDQGRHSWQLGAVLSYKMGYDYQWFVRPYYRSYFDSFTKSEYELNQNYDNIGLTVGCRYLL